MSQTVYNMELSRSITHREKPSEPLLPPKIPKSNDGTKAEEKKVQEYYDKLHEKNVPHGRPPHKNQPVKAPPKHVIAPAQPLDHARRNRSSDTRKSVPEPKHGEGKGKAQRPACASKQGAKHGRVEENKPHTVINKSPPVVSPSSIKASVVETHKVEERAKLKAQREKDEREKERIERGKKREEERRKMKEAIEKRKKESKSAQDVPFCLVQKTYTNSDPEPTEQPISSAPQDVVEIEPPFPYIPEVVPETEVIEESLHISSESLLITRQQSNPAENYSSRKEIELEKKKPEPTRDKKQREISPLRKHGSSIIKDEIRKMKQMSKVAGFGKSTLENFSEKDVLVNGEGVQQQIDEVTKNLSEKLKSQNDEQHTQDVMHMVDEMKNVRGGIKFGASYCKKNKKDGR